MLQYETSPGLRSVADAMVRAEAAGQFPAKVSLAIWACESNWGQNLTGDFNFWGITRNPEDGPAKFCDTHEVLTYGELRGFRDDERKTAYVVKDLGAGRYRFAMKRWFASYASLEDSAVDMARAALV